MTALQDQLNVLEAKVVLIEDKLLEHLTDEAQQEESKTSGCGSIGDNLSDGRHKYRDNLYLGLQLLQTLDKNSKNYAAVEAKVVGLFDKLTEEVAK